MSDTPRRRPNDVERFSSLVESVYDAARDPECWRDFLQGLAEALNAKSGVFRVIDERVPEVRTSIHYNLDPELQAAHREYFVSQDAYVEALRNHPGGTMAPGEALTDQDALRRTEFFADYLQPQDTWHICGGLALRNDHCTIMTGVQRDRKTGPFTREDAEYMARFIPHIRRANRLGHLIAASELRSTTAEQALESLAVGVVLLDEHEHVVHANHKGEILLRNEEGLARRKRGVCVRDANDSGELRQKFAAVRERARTRLAPIPETVLLTPTADQPRLLVFICPVPEHRPFFQGPWPRVTTAVFVSNLEDAGLLDHEILMTLYGLTASEARLACALARGRELAELSHEWNVSRETLRTHLKRALAKTGTNRQVELVRLLTGQPWSLAGGGERSTNAGTRTS